MAERSPELLAQMMLTFFSSSSGLKTSEYAYRQPIAHSRVKRDEETRKLKDQLALVRASLVSMQEEPLDSEFLDSTEFDFLEWRDINRKALITYGAGFRSQQLRGLFFASLAISAVVYPFVYKDLFPGAGDLGIQDFLAAAGSAVFFGFGAYQDKKLRSKILLRYEREESLRGLSIWQPYSPFGSAKKTIGSLKGVKRVVAIYGPPSVLLPAIKSAAVYKRRLEQSGVTLVAIPYLDDQDAKSKEEWEAVANDGTTNVWLWQPTDNAQWSEYFAELLSAKASASAKSKGAFFAIDLFGRSCASGLGSIVWDELLGTKLQPVSDVTQARQATYPAGSAEESILSAQKNFYEALAAADAARIASFFVTVDDDEVTALAESGRLDGWSAVTKNDATVGLTLSNEDVTVDANGKDAFTTGIEIPKAQGNDPTGTLLCTQRWVNVNGNSDSAPEWKLAQHRTIPYMKDIDAPACLRCDHRGCSSLERSGVRGPAGMPGDGVV